ncbi:MAG TPA: SRPBCC domain-containing protein [Candidatus Acidoferrales bacterium]|nr:SRPBCC domain-containing protein [Candidatus Acidoferrales bacterium]
MTTTTITQDQDAVVSEVEIAAPPERVFQALIDPKQVVEWWRNDTITMGRFELEPRVGGRWGYETKQMVNGVSKFKVHGEVLEYDPPRLLAYTWIANLHEDKTRRTVVRWELTPVSGGTLVKLVHSGLAQEHASRRGYSTGWPGVIERLRKFVEQ